MFYNRQKFIIGGLTGLTQVNKGNSRSLEEERQLDWQYNHRVRKHSVISNFLYDLQLLARSIETVFRAEGL